METTVNYISFDIERFVVDYFYKKQYLPERTKELLDITQESPTIGERVKTSNLPDPTYTIAVRRLNLSNIVKDYENHVRLYEKATKQLTEEEKKVIEACYSNNNKELPLRTKIEKLGYKRTKFYYVRDTALKKISRYIIG